LAYRLDRSAPQQAGLPIYLAAVGALGAILTTIVAAPVMMQVGQLSDNGNAALRDAFETFTLWGVYVRGGCFAATFVCLVWALVTYFRYQPAPPTKRISRDLLTVTPADHDTTTTTRS
jgi:Na+/proline symporter